MLNGVPDDIPFIDLVAPHLELEQELTGVFRRALHTAGFIGGRMGEDFDAAVAAFCSTNCPIAVSSAPDALRFAMMTCGVQRGDVLFTVPHTSRATTEAMSKVGAVPG